jgi:hypothetical protein
MPVGTACRNRKGTPPLSQKLSASDVQSMTSDSLMATKWHDRQDIRMLSILHSDKIVNIGKCEWKTKQFIMKVKHTVVQSCKMGSVDWTDMLLSYVQYIHKSVNWYKKLALHILNVALLSAPALYLMQNEKGMSLPDFQMSVIRGLLEKHKERRISSRGVRCSSGDIPQHLTVHHFPHYVPSTVGQENAMRKCHMCTFSNINLVDSTF